MQPSRRENLGAVEVYMLCHCGSMVGSRGRVEAGRYRSRCAWDAMGPHINLKSLDMARYTMSRRPKWEHKATLVMPKFGGDAALGIATTNDGVVSNLVQCSNHTTKLKRGEPVDVT